jgi:hypothetical protein
MARKRKGKSNPWGDLSEAMTFALDCQEIIARRMVRLARCDQLAFREAHRMITEKAVVATTATIAAALALPLGTAAATTEAASEYRKAVRANRRRLRR